MIRGALFETFCRHYSIVPNNKTYLQGIGHPSTGGIVHMSRIAQKDLPAEVKVSPKTNWAKKMKTSQNDSGCTLWNVLQKNTRLYSLYKLIWAEGSASRSKSVACIKSSQKNWKLLKNDLRSSLSNYLEPILDRSKWGHLFLSTWSP